MTLPSALEGHAVLVVLDGIGYLLPAIRPDMPPRLRRLLGPPARGHHQGQLSQLLSDRDRRCTVGAALG